MSRFCLVSCVCVLALVATLLLRPGQQTALPSTPLAPLGRGVGGPLPLSPAGRGEQEKPHADALAATFSIVAYDPERKAWGIGVASKYLAVGGAVPFARAGAGAVATQSFLNMTLGTKGLELLADGRSAEKTLDELKDSDKGIALRQLGIVDGKGEAATFTGKKCLPWAGGKTGKHFACQGNLLKDESVVDEMVKAYEENPKWPLAWRLHAALEAGEKAGGDKRGKQSAAILVVREKHGPNGFGDRAVDLRVDDHKTPVQELGRILALAVRKPAS